MNTGKTKNKFWNIILIVLLISLSQNINAQEKKLKIKYLGNMGVLISSGENKVLIDVLHKGNPWGYNEPSAEIIKNILNGENEFDGASLLLSTHNHADHFNAKLTYNFLQNKNNKAILTQQSVNDIQKDFDLSKVNSSITVTDNSENGIINFEEAGIKVKAINLSHGNETQNAGFIIEMNGFKIFHTGDAMPEADNFDKYNLAEENIDAILLPAWFFEEEVLVKSFEAKQNLFIHIHPDQLKKHGDALKNLPETLTELGEEFLYTKE